MSIMHNLQQLLPEFIFGAEGDNDGDASNEPGEGEGGANESTGGAPKESTHDDADDPKVKGLKSALDAERKRAEKAEKDLKARNKLDEEKALAEKSEIEQMQAKLEKANNNATKLAAGYLNSALTSALEKAARDAGFLDPSDAVLLIKRDALTFEQDQEDPSQVTIDEKSVTAAVKELATRKPHFIGSGTGDGDPTGSGFGGKRTKKQTTADELKSFYPSLN